MKNSIIIDYREHDCIKSFETQNINFKTENLDIGDFWIVDDNNKPLIIIERKRIDDFANSLTSGHLHEQKYRLLNNKDTPDAKILYILEGNLVYENQKIKRKSAAPIYSALWSILLGNNINLFQTKNAYHTCMCIHSISKKITKKGKFWDENISIGDYNKVLSSKKKDNKNPEQCSRNMLSCIHGVSYKVADTLLNKFGSINNICKMVNDDVFLKEACDIKVGKRRIGKKILERINEYLSIPKEENIE